MKKHCHFARLLGWTVALVGVLSLGAFARADQTVYDNTSHPESPEQFAQTGGLEFGDEVILTGGQGRYLTNFTFQYFGTGFSGDEQIRLRLYANNGVYYGETTNFITHTSTPFYAPGDMLYDSGFFNIGSYGDTSGSTLPFNLANSGFGVPVPGAFHAYRYVHECDR